MISNKRFDQNRLRNKQILLMCVFSRKCAFISNYDCFSQGLKKTQSITSFVDLLTLSLKYLLMLDGHSAKNAHKNKEWCCFRDCVMPQTNKDDRIIGKYPANSYKKCQSDKISLKKKRPFTCNLGTNKKLDSTNLQQTQSNYEPNIHTNFSHSYYTPQGKLQQERYHFGNKYESPRIRSHNCSFEGDEANNQGIIAGRRGLEQSFYSNYQKPKSERGKEKVETCFLGEEKKVNISQFKRINFTYLTNKLMEPEIVPTREFTELTQNSKLKKHHFQIQKTVDIELPRKSDSKNIDQKNSYTSLRLNKEPSRPITLNYSSFQDPASLPPEESIHSTPEEQSINLPNQAQFIQDQLKVDPNKSLQMTNLPTERCMNSLHGSLKNSRPLKKSDNIKNHTEKSFEKISIGKKLSDSSNIAYSVNGSQGSEGKQSIVVDMVPQQPLSPHILKIKSQRESKTSHSKHSKVFFLSEIKL